MWTLPKERSITIRRIEKPLRDFVQVALTGSWDGDRLHVVIAPRYCVENGRYCRDGRGRLFWIDTGHTDSPPVVQERHGADNLSPWKRTTYSMGELEPGVAFVVRDGAMVDIYVQQLWRDDYTQGQLEVARDAALSAGMITPTVYQLAREALPRAHGLFVALVRKELNPS